MSMNDVYGDSVWLKAADLKGRKVTVRIQDWDIVEFKDSGKKQTVLNFMGTKKKLGCNATNAKMIASLYGNSFDDWIGKEVTLYPTKTNSPSGQLVDCIRVDAFVEKKSSSPELQQAIEAERQQRQPAPAKAVPIRSDMDDEIPF